MNATIDYKRGQVLVSFRYHPALVEKIKALSHRYPVTKPYDGETKTWRLSSDSLGQVNWPTLFGGCEITKEFMKAEEAAQAAKRNEDAFTEEAIARLGDLGQPLKDGKVLFEHQKEAVVHLVQSRRVILAHDMGTGKSRVALVAAKKLSEVTGYPIKVICPANLKSNWQAESRAVWVPIQLHSWAKVPKPEDGQRFILIADEAHYAQSMRSARTKAFLDLADLSFATFLLSGTPMRNGRPINLLPLLRAIKHPVAANRSRYEQHFCEGHRKQIKVRGEFIDVWDNTGVAHLDELNEQLKGWMLRKKKSECLDLPPKTRVILNVEPKEEVQAVYDRKLAECRAGFNQRVEAGEVLKEAEAVALLTFLRQASSAAKVEPAIELIDDALEEGGQVLVFTAFRETAQKIANHYAVNGHSGEPDAPCVAYLGGLSNADKDRIVSNFQAGRQRVFPATIDAGGIGLNLTAANTVILLDRPMTPGDAEQAEDRAYRAGTKWPVTSYWLSAFAVDRVIDRLLGEKTGHIDQVMNGLIVPKEEEAANAQRVLARTVLRELLRKNIEEEA